MNTRARGIDDPIPRQLPRSHNPVESMAAMKGVTLSESLVKKTISRSLEMIVK